jgi:hypothetical protein
MRGGSGGGGEEARGRMVYMPLRVKMSAEVGPGNGGYLDRVQWGRRGGDEMQTVLADTKRARVCPLATSKYPVKDASHHGTRTNCHRFANFGRCCG